MQLLTTRARAQRAAAEVGDGEPAEEVTCAMRVRALVAAAVGPLITGYAVVAALLALVTAIASQARFSPMGVLLAAGPGWLAAHQVPVDIAGQPLGVLPLLATIGSCVLVARTAGGTAQRLGYREPVQAVP